MVAIMEEIWHEACEKVGEDIDMYAGLRHSSCSQYINEKHYSIDQVQMMTDPYQKGECHEVCIRSIG
ncbi:MAG: hypothetical protein LLG04_18150 [Parachlamydia sp.]|nr:hypothetical protein [Parachlamydia sp.]